MKKITRSRHMEHEFFIELECMDCGHEEVITLTSDPKLNLNIQSLEITAECPKCEVPEMKIVGINRIR